MDVRDAVASRYSCRAFLPTPVPQVTVREIWTVRRGRRQVATYRHGGFMPSRGSASQRLRQSFRRGRANCRKARAANIKFFRATSKSRTAPPFRGRRTALPVDRRARGRSAGALCSICQEFSVLRRARRDCFSPSTKPCCRRNGPTSAASSRPSWCWRGPMGCTPARSRPGSPGSAPCGPFLELPDELMLFCGMALGYADTPRRSILAFAAIPVG